MGLSRLENFLKSVRGTILYVDPNSLDSTDSIENKGNSLTRPFKTIQRALIEAARFSYQSGLNNDRFGKTTILVYPGDHIIDNRPGWIPDGANNFRLRNGQTSNAFPPFELTTNFDLADPDNALYKLNSIHGGVIVPRGTSLVGLDLRKTKIRPKYVPNPINDNIERSTIFRVTGGCYFWQFSMFDADPSSQCYVDYTSNLFVPNFSHHKLTCFEYADGVNNVLIDDDFQTYTTDRTDLDMYYEKVGLAYGVASGRAIEPDYPSTSLDIESKIDEYRIVGSTGLSVGISSIRAGDGVNSTSTITVDVSSTVAGLEVDTPIRIEGVSVSGYNGNYIVSEKVNDTRIRYQVQNAPVNPLPSVLGSTLSLSSDTVTSASPYIFNISLRSVYGMCGVLADGDKASGFKSMVIAQFTGIGLQKDDNAFVVYNETTGVYDDNAVAGNETISTNSRAVYKPEYKNFHVKCINDAFIQNVSIFAIGYAEHFVVENGGDQSVTNSNSNFGAKSLVASGFRKNAFPQDDFGYITHIIPPKELPNGEISVEFNAIDVAATVGVGTTNERLYLYNETNQDVQPEHILEGYRIGVRENDNLKVIVSAGGTSTEYTSRIVMPNSQSSYEKSFRVGRSVVGINSISSNILKLTTPHTFENGETIRVISETGQLPDGLQPNTVYYAITNANVSSGLTTSVDIKLAKTLNDAKNGGSGKEITLNNKGGSLTIVSRVSDKSPGDIGHPVGYDTSIGQWYIKVSTASTENTIHSAIVGLGTTSLGAATARTYVNRKKFNRNSVDTIYRVRYVIPAANGGAYARPPSDGFILQESNTTLGPSNTEIQTYFGSGSITNINQQRNFRIIADASWSSLTNTVKVVTEIPHNLQVGSQVELVNIKSSTNPAGVGNSGFNKIYTVAGISSAKEFVVSLDSNPGTFANNVNARDTNLPYFKRKRYNNTYYIYRNQEAQRYVPGKQDGVYYLTLINASNSPTVAPFTEEKYSQPVKELYPQTSRDNPVSDPDETRSFASSGLIGEVVVNDVRNSITKETINKVLSDIDVGVGVTNVISGTATTHTVYTSIDHGLNRITKLNSLYSGVGYGSGSAESFYNARLVGFAGSTTGYNATAKITVNPSGNITAIQIMDGGSAYGIGNTLTVVGVSTFSGFVPAVFEVTGIYNNVGDTFRISGVSSSSYNEYNDLYRISDVSVGSAKSFSAVSTKPISGFSVTGIGQTSAQRAFAYLTDKSLSVTSLAYNNVSGLATVTTTDSHGLSVGNKIRLSGATQSLYNGDFVVTKNVGLSTFILNIGVSTNIPTVSGTIFAHRGGATSNDGVISSDNENLAGRMIANYAGITTTLLYEVNNETIDEITIRDIDKLDIRIGDYLQIDDELVRVKTTVPTTISSTDPVYVFRGVLGTRASRHVINSVVRKVSVTPIEFRRHSIIRASGHTFEYVGFGPGNYSTAFPDKQNRQISAQEELLGQSTRREGGINFYTGMNDKGISYSGNKKLSTVTGQEEIFDTPVQTITGEDIGNELGLNVINPVEGNFRRSIKVDGGENGDAISQFDGPVIFGDKVTSTSTKGFEVNSLFLQGNQTVSRKYTVGETKPTIAGNPGDVQYNANPSNIGYLGWVYTSNNEWKEFGKIGIEAELTGVGIKTSGGSVGFSTLVNFVAGNNISIVSQYNSSTETTTLTLDATPNTGISSGGIFGVGIKTSGGSVGFSTLVDFVAGNNISIASQYNSITETTTLTLDTSPKIGISSGVFNTFVGIATQINFVGYGVTVATTYGSSGIATVTIIGSSSVGVGGTTNPGLPDKSIQYNNSGSFGGVPIFTYNDSNNNLQVQGSSTTPLLKVTQTGTGDCLVVEDQNNDTTTFVVTNNGAIGIGSSVPTAKVDINAESSQAINIRSTSGSGNIIRIDDSADDTTPLVYTATGNLALGTASPNEKLDVIGNIGLNGALRLYNSGRTAYSALQAPTSPGNLTFTLPNSYGSNGQALISNGAGTLSWGNVSGGGVTRIVAGTNVTISSTGGSGTGDVTINAVTSGVTALNAGSGISLSSSTGSVTITNSGVTQLTAGTGISLSGSTGSITISSSGASYPFTTKGFSMPL